MKQRLQKLIAQTNLSRRSAEQWIKAGRVQVNGVVSRLGDKADPTCDRICIDGKPLVFPEHKLLIAFHKPRHVMVTRSDPQGRPTVYDYLPPQLHALKPVGRLDFESEGLLLFTNDGDLHQRLSHPRHHVDKSYELIVSPPPTEAQLEALAAGAGGYEPLSVRILRQGKGRSHLELRLNEGKNRQLRRMCAAVGLSVERLIRTSIGPVVLGKLPRGEWRRVG